MNINPRAQTFTDIWDEDFQTTASSYQFHHSPSTSEREDEEVTARSKSKANLQALQDDLRKAGYRKVK